MLQEKLKRHYEKQGSKLEWIKYFSKDIKYAFFGRRREVINRFIKESRKLKLALDIGCGSGVYSLDLARKGYKVYSIDIASLYVRQTIKLARNNGKRIQGIVASAEYLPFQDETFDMVLCTEVLEHLVSPLSALKELKRVCKVNGKIIITIPSSLSLTELYRRDREHLHRFLPLPFIEFLKDNLMHIDHTCSCNFFIHYLRHFPFASWLRPVWLLLDENLGGNRVFKYFGWCFIIVGRRKK